MRVIDYINIHLSDWPYLYYKPTFEKSAFSILHQAFIVLGNGVEWAQTDDPTKGGYLVNPIFIETSDGEYVRSNDLDYGTEKFELDRRFFKEEMVSFYSVDMEHSIAFHEIIPGRKPIHNTDGKEMFVSDAKRDGLLDAPHVWKTGEPFNPEVHTHMINPLVRDRYSEREDPYPNFQRKYSCFWEIEPNLIQKDWRQAGIAHLKHWAKYFNDPARYKNYSGFTAAEGLKKWIEEPYPKKYGDDWIEQVRSGYLFDGFDGTNYEAMAEHINARRLAEAQTFLKDTIDRLTI